MCGFKAEAIISPPKKQCCGTNPRAQVPKNTMVPLEQNGNLILGNAKKKLMNQIH